MYEVGLPVGDLEVLRASAVAMVKEERVPRAETKVDERFKVSQDADWANNRRLWCASTGGDANWLE